MIRPHPHLTYSSGILPLNAAFLPSRHLQPRNKAILREPCNVTVMSGLERIADPGVYTFRYIPWLVRWSRPPSTTCEHLPEQATWRRCRTSLWSTPSGPASFTLNRLVVHDADPAVGEISPRPPALASSWSMPDLRPPSVTPHAIRRKHYTTRGRLLVMFGLDRERPRSDRVEDRLGSASGHQVSSAGLASRSSCSLMLEMFCSINFISHRGAPGRAAARLVREREGNPLPKVVSGPLLQI